MSMLLTRAPHPIEDLETAMQNGLLVCQPRGYCGPFINQDFYDAFPDPLWNGKGDCMLCGSTCDVETQEELRAEVLRDD
jgi:hypothetical protein